MIDTLQLLIGELKLISDIFDIVWNRMYIGQPQTEQSSPYITFNIISQTNNLINNRTRIEIRFIGANKTDFKTLEVMDKAISNYIYNNYTKIGIKFELWNIVYWYDGKKKTVLIRDIIIYQTQDL